MARGVPRPEAALNALHEAIAESSKGKFKGFSNSVVDAKNSAFDIEPAKTQHIQAQIQQSSDFLTKAFDMETVVALAGEYDRIGTTGQVLSTVTTDRYGYDPTAGGVQPYQLEEVTSDTAITYSQLAKWYHRPEFLMIVQAKIRQLRADSYEKVGWWGQTRVTGRTAAQEPLGKQIAVGFLQWLINNKPSQVWGISLAGGDTGGVVAYRSNYTIDPIKVGSADGADYANLDLLIEDMINDTAKGIPVEFQDNLSVIGGREIFATYNRGLLDTVAGGMDRLASERFAAAQLKRDPKIDFLTPVFSNFAPTRLLAVTRLKDGLTGNAMDPLLADSNLIKLNHEMVQKSYMDVPAKSAFIDYMYENMFYGLRNPEAMVFVHPDALQFWNGSAWVSAATAWKIA